jgi:soluble lytic murein transglycosylase-like protein
MAKVIDALVVTLGLDPSGYKKGAAEANAAQAGLKQSAQADANTTTKSAETGGAAAKKLGAEKRKQDNEERKRQRQREREAREQQTQEGKRTEASLGRLKSLGLAAAGAVLGFNTIKGAVEAYLGATNQLANLGRVAPTIGTDVKALDTLGDAYKQVGGKAEEAGSDIAKLAHAQFSFAINAPDAMAGWMRRLGVSAFDEKGNPRDKIQIQNEIAASLQRQTKDIQTQAMYAREMGLSESFIQLYLVKSATERAKILKDAQATAKASKEAADAAIVEEQARARLKNSVKGMFQNVVASLAPGIAKIENAIVDAGQNASVTSGDRTLKSLGLTAGTVGGKGNVPTKYDAAFAAAERKHGLPQGLLKGVAHRESNFNPEAKSNKGAIGLMQLMPKYFPNAGKSTDADIETAAAELERLIKYYRKMYGQSTALKLALAAYNNGQRNVGNAIKEGRQLPAETRAYVPAVEKYTAGLAPTAGAGGTAAAGGSTSNVSNVHIDEMNIHTKATDGPGIAATLPAALQRQGVVAQANSGMN